LNIADHWLQMTRCRIARQRGGYRAATFVTEHNNQTRTEMFDRVFDTTEAVIIDQVAGVPNPRKIPDVFGRKRFRVMSANQRNRG